MSGTTITDRSQSDDSLHRSRSLIRRVRPLVQKHCSQTIRSLDRKVPNSSHIESDLLMRLHASRYFHIIDNNNIHHE